MGYPYMVLQYIHEELLGVTFRVSPDSFFQVNSKGTEVLYSTVGGLVDQLGHHGNLPVVYGRVKWSHCFN